MEVTALQHLFSGSGETILKRGDLNIEATILTEEEACLLQARSPWRLSVWSISSRLRRQTD